MLGIVCGTGGSAFVITVELGIPVRWGGMQAI